MTQQVEREALGGGRIADPFAAAVHATRMPMLITDARASDNPIIYVNDAFLLLTGYTREEVIGRNCRFLQGSATNAADVAKVRDAIDRRVSIEIDLLNYRKDGTTFWNRLLVSPVFDEAGQLTFFFASQFDVTPERDRFSRVREDRDSLEREIEQRVIDLGRSEDRLRFALRAARLGAWTLDLPSRRLVVSAVFKQIFGSDSADTFGLDELFAAVEPADLAALREPLEQVMAEGGEFDVECRIRRGGGETHWVEIRGEAICDAAGMPIALAGVAFDTTERKRSEEHRDLLVRELNHRVKNTLATVQSILAQSLRSAEDLREAEAVAAGRLQALARAHDVLTRDAWSGAGMQEIVANALEPFRVPTENRIRFGGPDLMLGPKRATALTLAVHELATNAAKYGALSNETGTIILNWDNSAGRFHLVWREEDGPEVSEPARRGFGSRLIERTLVAEFGGEASMEYRPTGVVFELESSAADLVETDR